MRNLLPWNGLCAGLLLVINLYLANCQKNNTCDKSPCLPATGNLLIGRDDKLIASSTCGLNEKVKFCIVSHLQEKKKCFWCDSRVSNPLLSHRINNIIYQHYPGTKQESWWQSVNGVENVTIQLDLETEFHFTHLIMYFKTFRPASMLIERSSDFGKTWQVYKYFAQDCDRSFPGISKEPPQKLTDVVCESRYSTVPPFSGGEVLLRVLPPNLHHLYNNPYSPEVQKLLKITNLRLNFTKLHTLGDDLLDTRGEIKEKYYYAITQMIVRGSCSCHGHAHRCVPLSNADSTPEMVHGKCQCTHNTKGLNCQECMDFFNDLPWKAAFGKQPNACKQCSCNNHATKCHFDPYVFEMTGRVSGGVCDDCEHNTEGKNCEKCKSFFYSDPNKDFSDPDVCVRCDCDPAGSLDAGLCDPYTNEAEGLISGNCHCKPNVGGKRCDACKDGYWNFNETSAEGCELCTCDARGTLENEGCDKRTGECTCKRNVQGRHCNQCLPHFYGLSDSDPNGCKPCECDVGGSSSTQCDSISGQCPCLPHTSGRTCSLPEQSFFSGSLDHMVYEAELSNCTNCLVQIREPFRDGRETTWTGTGFMKTYENTGMEFEIDNVKTPMDYDIVIRYEPELNGDWENVEVVVERNEPVNPNGPCGNAILQDDVKSVRLPSTARAVKVHPPVCLEPGKKYKVHLKFYQFNNGTDNPSASILIDSIALIPSIPSIPFFQGPENYEKLREFERYRCGDYFITVYKGSPIPEACRNYQYSIGIYVHGGARDCECDPTGSKSGICDQIGGKCVCKPNVGGRRCDRCDPGTYGFGPEGCKSCDCNSVGALDNFCDATTGQCKCRAQTYGRECDQCSPGSWNYPNCQKCICNGHADLCDSKTGACKSCKNFTEGETCDRCIMGYYGDPRLGIDIPCRACPCPGTVESGLSYADRCELDTRSQDVICECKEGHGGTKCDVCLDNYFGDPKVLGSSCSPCNCSNNIDLITPGNCDTLTGKCLQCLYQTEGDHCEMCKSGFFGNALEQTCAECVCDILGTDKSKGDCDKNTGQCPCLPNVIGFSCDQCVANHWKIASGEGCEPCDCDPVGSLDVECNLYDGQCTCKEGFGGRRCDQCQSYFWGNPNVECYPCDCDPQGSRTRQCQQSNGTCICNPGIGGNKCNTCARGYIGTAPYCSSCGECFDNWDSILHDLTNQTNKIITEALTIKQTGASGAYTKEFETLEKRIDEVKILVENTTRSSHDLSVMLKSIDEIKSQVNLNDDPNGIGKNLGNTTQRINLASLALSDLKNKADLLKVTGELLKENATQLQENNVEGALTLTRDAQKKSLDVKLQSGNIEKQIAEAERQCKRAEGLLTRSSNQFLTSQEENDKSLQRLNEKINILETRLPELNELICDKRGSPCDDLCGGAGCGVCGGITCDAGAVSKSNSAKKFAEDSKEMIYHKETKAEELFRGITTARQEAITANTLAKDVYDNAVAVRNKTAGYVAVTANLTKKMDEFINAKGATPSDIRELATIALNKNIQLKPEQISELANQIGDIIKSLTDIDTILTATADDLAKAKELKYKADSAKTESENILGTAQQVVDALKEAQIAQDKAESAIQTAKDDIFAARKDLSQITSETNEAQQKANDTNGKVSLLQDRLKSIQRGYLQNERAISDVESEEKALEVEVSKAQSQALDLKLQYQQTDNKLHFRAETSGLKRAKGQKLLEKASQLSVNTTSKLKELMDAESIFNNQEKVLANLSTKITELNNRVNRSMTAIKDKSEYYRVCS